MGDVFIILVLTHFGPGPALVTYYADILTTHITEALRRHGLNLRGKILLHRWAFNLASCTVSVFSMHVLYRAVRSCSLSESAEFLLGLFVIAISWFAVNTITASLAIALSTSNTFWSVWREGMALYVLNSSGSAAAAGLISLFYEQAGFTVFLLCVPLAVVLYQLHAFYVQRYDQAETHVAELTKLYLQTVEAMANAVDAKDRYTHGHIRRVQAYAVELAKCLGITDEQELMGMKAGALLHDIGKIAVPEYILNKPTVLTETEYEKMKIHPVVGANMLKSIDFPFPVIPAVKSHHERWDGNGYPDGLKGEQIPMNARILSLVDCYDALTTNRPYRSPMHRTQILEFFESESGRAYDPEVVQTFIANLDQIEAVGRSLEITDDDFWGIREAPLSAKPVIQPLEKARPTVSYGKALTSAPEIQRELYSVFEFSRTDIRCLNNKDIYNFVGARLQKVLEFDLGVFYTADLAKGIITSEHVMGPHGERMAGITLDLEQKLTGWVAANNQGLYNLPPFPDFLKCPEPCPSFQISAIVPLNYQDRVLGAIALYRIENAKFSEEDLRRLEIISSQTSMIIDRCARAGNTMQFIDSVTNLPTSLQLYLMFDQIAVDANRYEYPLAVLSIHFDEMSTVRKRWGHLSGDEMVRAAANRMTKELRETDLLIRHAGDEFVVLTPRTTRETAEALKSRLQNSIDRFRFTVRMKNEIPLSASIGLAVFPEDGTDLEALLSVSEWRVREDRELRSAVAKRVRKMPLT